MKERKVTKETMVQWDQKVTMEMTVKMVTREQLVHMDSKDLKVKRVMKA